METGSRSLQPTACDIGNPSSTILPLPRGDVQEGNEGDNVADNLEDNIADNEIPGGNEEDVEGEDENENENLNELPDDDEHAADSDDGGNQQFDRRSEGGDSQPADENNDLNEANWIQDLEGSDDDEHQHNFSLHHDHLNFQLAFRTPRTVRDAILIELALALRHNWTYELANKSA
ncbi:Cell division cycle protein 27-like protein [Frankliniella fusca]|uniref:Cell division cycle protein 27-like protein n=1 Tax=Frankliniella fusca TaxID=407009 RepID=A0AAE1LDK4_9NEOP|nr:Cell division cycle protein 27-like protein [Frankliniella fusca]